MEEYCQDHPDEFEWVGGFIEPVLTYTWSGPVEALKDCDYLVSNLANDLLSRYRAADKEETIREGSGYLGACHSMYAFFEILKNAVQETGAEGFDSQAFYNAAVEYTAAWEGYPEWSFGEDDRYLVDQVAIYEWSEDADDLVIASDGWIDLLVE